MKAELFADNAAVSMISINFICFAVNGREVKWDIRKGYMVCNCRHEVYRGGNLNKKCYHIKAVEKWLDNHAKFCNIICNAELVG